MGGIWFHPSPDGALCSSSASCLTVNANVFVFTSVCVEKFSLYPCPCLLDGECKCVCLYKCLCGEILSLSLSLSA